jgi:hypothetical protein
VLGPFATTRDPNDANTFTPSGQSAVAASTEIPLGSTRETTPQQLLRGLQSLQLSLPPHIRAKVSANYAGMTAMERFMAESLGVTLKAGDLDGYKTRDVAQHEMCVSCWALLDQPYIGSDLSHHRSEACRST